MTNNLLIAEDSEKTLFPKLLGIIWVTGILLFLTACGAAHVPDEKSAEQELRDDWGIEVTSLRMTAAGHMIDFRYRVLDAEKAKTLFVRKNKPYLIDQETQKVLSVPVTAKIGPLRNSDYPKEDKIYWMFFGNTGGLIQSGSKVTVVIGEFRAENLVVQ